MDTGPRPQKEFFRAATEEAVRGGARRVLISGTADYNLPALALWACAAAGLMPEMTVIDVCETPLRLCTWFAERSGVKMETVLGDIMTYRPEHAFDLIFVHSFLGYFPSAAWDRLISAWRGALAPGGRVILVNRIRPNAPQTVGFSAEQAKAFHARLLQEAVRHADEIGVDPERVAAMTDRYAACCVMYSLRSVDALTAAFEAGGFRIALLEVDESESAKSGTSPGPTLAGGAEYVKLVARKR
jgi:SAM-dependent methyltransferase